MSCEKISKLCSPLASNLDLDKVNPQRIVSSRKQTDFINFTWILWENLYTKISLDLYTISIIIINFDFDLFKAR